ncbi:MAG: ribulose-phosphate 3-epimerase [Eubacterium sp.]|nr:ribulose-phosphate 3-epimerase [Eubacterium sp.]
MNINILAPSMLAIDFGNMEKDLKEVYSAGAYTIHVDVMDGMFVPNISFGPPVIRHVRRILPEAVLDVHMMVTEPARYLERFKTIGINNFTIHYEATKDPEGTLKQIREAGLKVGVSIKPGTPVSVLEPVIDMVDQVLIMSVEPGFGGQSFMPQSYERISAVRKLREDIDIEVDGGIYLDNVKDVLDAGANVIVAGSAIFKGDITENVTNFREKLGV